MDLPKFSKSKNKIININNKKSNKNKTNEKEEANDTYCKSQKYDDLITMKLNFNNKIDKIREYEIIKEVGEGSFGSIYLTKKENTNKFYALKVINKEYIIKLGKIEDPFIEKYILNLCKHPSIIKLKSTFQTQKNLYFVLEYAKNKDLNYLLKKLHIIPNEVSKQMIAELVNAIEYLHIEMKISHNDLKPSNIMLDKNYHIKSVDFSTAKIHGKIFEKSTKKFVEAEKFISYEIIGTYEYLSPEMLNHTLTDYRTNDIWALGIIIYSLYNGETPFIGKNDFCTCNNIQKAIFSFVNKNMDEEVKDLISHILVLDTSKRYNIEQIKQHKFFKDINWNDLLKNKIPMEKYLSEYKEAKLNNKNNFDNFFSEIEIVNNNENNLNDNYKKKEEECEINIYQKNFKNDIIKDFYYIRYNFYNNEPIDKNRKSKEKIIYEGIVTKIELKEEENKEIRLILYNNYNLHIINNRNNKLLKKIKVNKKTLIKVENQSVLIIDKYKFKSCPKEIIKWFYLISDVYYCK